MAKNYQTSLMDVSFSVLFQKMYCMKNQIYQFYILFLFIILLRFAPHAKCTLLLIESIKYSTFNELLIGQKLRLTAMRVGLLVTQQPVQDTLWLGVGTPWVDRVYDGKSVPGFLKFEPFEFGK